MQGPSSSQRRHSTALWVIYLLLLSSCQAGGSVPTDDDDHVLLQLDAASTDVSLDKLKPQLGSDVTDCSRLPVGNWVSCKLAPAAVASTAVANTVVQNLASMQVVQTMNNMKSIVSGVSAATASAAGATTRRAFKRVGRGKKVYISVRRLSQQPNAPLDSDPSLAAAAAASDNTPAAAVDPALQSVLAAATAAQATAAGALPQECSGGSCSKLWGMDRIGVAAVWQQMGRNMPLKRITRPITIIDTGADAWNWNVVTQIDMTKSTTFTINSQRSTGSDGGKAGDSSHGTHVFGTVAGAWGGNDPSGVAGIFGPANGSIVSCNAFGNNGDVQGASINDIIRCLAHARKNNAHWVVNLSLGGEWSRNDAVVALLREGLNTHICDAGGIIVAAAHNYNKNVNSPGVSTATYPAAFAGNEVPCLIAVASIDKGDLLSPFSNFGNSVKIAAPGGSIWSSVNSRSGANVWAAGELSGTSMASPHVAGAAALLMNAFPGATSTQIKACLINTATDTVQFQQSRNAVLGGGILNVKAAYDCVAAFAGPDCATAALPGCVDAASGVLDASCEQSTSSFFCLAVGNNHKCRYDFKPAGQVCNSATGAACSGTRATCPKVSNPTKQDDGDVDCTSDNLQQCAVDGLCSADDGCKCSAAYAARRSPAGGCLCAANLGFVSIKSNTTGLSRCRWNVSFAGTRHMSAPLNSRVVLPVNLMGGTMCPRSGMKVIVSAIIMDTVPCESAPRPLQTTTEPLGESCRQYVLDTTKAGATSGSCYRLRVHTTDTRNYNLILMYQ